MSRRRAGPPTLTDGHSWSGDDIRLFDENWNLHTAWSPHHTGRIVDGGPMMWMQDRSNGRRRFDAAWACGLPNTSSVNAVICTSQPVPPRHLERTSQVWNRARFHRAPTGYVPSAILDESRIGHHPYSSCPRVLTASCSPKLGPSPQARRSFRRDSPSVHRLRRRTRSSRASRPRRSAGEGRTSRSWH